MSAQELNLLGHFLLIGALAVGVFQIGLLWALVRMAGKGRPGAPVTPSGDLEVDMLENEIDRLRGELYRLRNERDWLRKECARLADGQG